MSRYYVDVGGETLRIDVEGGCVRVEGQTRTVDLVQVEGTGIGSLILDGVSYRVVSENPSKGRWDVYFGGESHETRVVDERTRHIEAMTGAREGPAGPAAVRAPMPGMVVRIEVREGDRVEPGQGVAIVEAMKMENELKADAHARVARVHVSEGQAVEKDEVLIEMEPPEGDEDGDA